MRTVPGKVLAVLVLLLALSHASVGIYPYGVAVWVRPVFSLVGIAGAILLLRGVAGWRILLSVWCLLQTWVIATDCSGRWFDQGLFWGWVHSDSVRANQTLIELSERGVNYVGLLLFGVLAVIMGFGLHPPIRRRLSPRWGKGIAVGAGVLLIAWGIRQAWLRWDQAHAIAVLDLDVPRVPIYFRDQFLGRTPLAISPDAVRRWHLPLNPAGKLRLFNSGWEEALLLSDGDTTLCLWAGVPMLFRPFVDIAPTAYGDRTRVAIRKEDGPRLTGELLRRAKDRDEMICTISFADPAPHRPVEPILLRVAASNPTSRHLTGTAALIAYHFLSTETRNIKGPFLPYSAIEVPLPADWHDWPPAASRTTEITIPAPGKAQDYELFCTLDLLAGNSRGDLVEGSAYSNMLHAPVAGVPTTTPSTKP